MAPLRVVSLLPSATDTVEALDALGSLVARSHECDHPGIQHLPAITSSKVGQLDAQDTDMAMAAGGAALAEAAQWGAGRGGPALLHMGLAAYAVDLAALAAAKPDLILTQLQDVRGSVDHSLFAGALRQLLGYQPRLVHLAAGRLSEVWSDMAAIAAALGLQEQGRSLVAQLKTRLAAAAAVARGRARRRVLCIQWPDPLYAAGAWVPELVRMAGGTDVAGRVDGSVCLQPDQLPGLRPDVVVFALCGHTLASSRQAAAGTLQRLRRDCSNLPACFAAERVVVLDGERALSRPGPLLAPSLEALVEALHGEAQAYGHCGSMWQHLAGATATAAQQQRVGGQAPGGGREAARSGGHGAHNGPGSGWGVGAGQLAWT